MQPPNSAWRAWWDRGTVAAAAGAVVAVVTFFAWRRGAVRGPEQDVMLVVLGAALLLLCLDLRRLERFAQLPSEVIDEVLMPALDRLSTSRSALLAPPSDAEEDAPGGDNGGGKGAAGGRRTAAMLLHKDVRLDNAKDPRVAALPPATRAEYKRIANFMCVLKSYAPDKHALVLRQLTARS